MGYISLPSNLNGIIGITSYYCVILKLMILHDAIKTNLGVWVVLAIFAKKPSSFRLPYQRPSSSADCARELFNGSNGSASLVDCTREKIFCLGGAGFCE